MGDFNEIIHQCVSGDNKAQEQVYRQFSGKMFGVCLHYAKDYTEAEDILQESFYKVFKNIKQFRFKGSFEGWIRKIVVNTAIDRFQRQKHLYAVDDIYDYSEDFSYDDIISDITAKDLIQLIQELSPKYRMVFSLYAIEGYTHDEIGKKLGISTGTSKSNLSRARTILQKRVRDLFGTKSKKIAMI